MACVLANNQTKQERQQQMIWVVTSYYLSAFKKAGWTLVMIYKPQLHYFFLMMGKIIRLTWKNKDISFPKWVPVYSAMPSGIFCLVSAEYSIYNIAELCTVNKYKFFFSTKCLLSILYTLFYFYLLFKQLVSNHSS